ncbi:hypothetical protein HDC93_006024 [Streptomyces sp. AK010]|nr:hypothetical protein [Streptomyces sp. AK010]
MSEADSASDTRADPHERERHPHAEDDRAAVAGVRHAWHSHRQVVDRPRRRQLSEDPEDMLRWGGLLGARYMGDDRAEEYAARNGGPGNLLVRGHIDKVIAFDGIAD